MTPANKLKLNFTILCLLCVFWYLDRPFPDSSAIYRNTPQFAFAPKSNTATLSWSLPAYIRSVTAQHPGQTGAYILENGYEAWLARAWLADHATRSIDVQYAVWSADKIGTLASEALLRAADRGVKVRIIIGDSLITAEDITMLALAKHPNIEIRIYHPKQRTSSNAGKRLWNIINDFKAANQGMHDKTFVVDGGIAITGGRDMASDYFDFHHATNLRDREALILGKTVSEVKNNFDNFWQHPLSLPVEKIFAEHRFMQTQTNDSDPEVPIIYLQLHDYANQVENSDPLLKQALQGTPASFERLAKEILWTDVDFIHDIPGKKIQETWQNNGNSSRALAGLMKSAQKEIVIQLPYLVLSNQALALIRNALQRGVKIIVNTNSLASTDNLQAFSAYQNQREDLLKMGVEIFEFRPDAKPHTPFLNSQGIVKAQSTVLRLHAQSLVVDNKTAYIGSFYFDPRSENLNSEVGVIIHSPQLASQLAKTIRQDMQTGNSWNAKNDEPDQFSSYGKRLHVWLLQLLPLGVSARN